MAFVFSEQTRIELLILALYLSEQTTYFESIVQIKTG